MELNPKNGSPFQFWSRPEQAGRLNTEAAVVGKTDAQPHSIIPQTHNASGVDARRTMRSGASERSHEPSSSSRTLDTRHVQVDKPLVHGSRAFSPQSSARLKVTPIPMQGGRERGEWSSLVPGRSNATPHRPTPTATRRPSRVHMCHGRIGTCQAAPHLTRYGDAHAFELSCSCASAMKASTWPT